MKRHLLLLAGLLVAGAPQVGAAVLTLDLQPLDTQPYLYSTNYDRGVNYRSGRGVPLSSSTNNPAGGGSDGRATDGGTANQFMGQLTFGAVTRPAATNLVTTGSTTNLAQNAANLDLPRGTKDGKVVLVLRGNAGASYFSRQTMFAFGAVITPPVTDEAGGLLSVAVRSTYWAPEPLSTNNHVGAPYYWSPHAGRVFAVQPGPVPITWRKATGTTNVPTGPSTNIGGTYYPLTNVTYIVGGNAVKTPRKIYWTERTFRSTGKPVSVPTAQVRALRFVYSSVCPEHVAEEFVAPGESLIATNALKETRTIWYDAEHRRILAYNREGRIFLELLGDTVEGEARRHLGYEIVDVFKEVAPLDVPVELGEELTPYPGRPDPTLTPERVTGADLTKNFVYQHTANGRIRFYATAETQNTNDMLLHWLEEGVEGLQWPLVFARYHQGWPSDATRYSHYVRPRVASEAEAQQTAVPLPTDNVPVIEYQDLDALQQKRGQLTPEFRFYSYLEEAFPVHRTLLRFTSGDRVRFERVLSVLNTTLSAQVPADGSAQDRVILPPEPWLTGSTLIKPGSALRLNGPAASGNTYGQMPAGDYFGESAFTIETWILVREHRAWARVLDFGNGAANNNVLLAASRGGSQLPGLQFFDGGGTLKLDLTSDTQLLQNQWVHLVATYESGTACLYQDGVLTASKTGVPAPASVTRTNCFIGRSNWPGDPDAKADFANFRIWSVARTPSQIVQDRTSVYSSGTPGLTAQFLFNGTGNPAVDSSGNGKNMTNFGSFVLGAGSDHPFPPSGLVPALTNLTAAPRFVRQTVYVGDRLAAPAGELGGNGDAYYAGYLNQSQGILFHPGAYRDPFATDFDSKQSGAIIPVNAIPGTNQLEVLWFRKNQASAAQGFKPVYWPSILGRYLIAWPTSPSEIVLASNDGSGPLDSLQAKGTIYTQNDPALPGYNPNEEHAVLIGGQAYALRDDLNLTGATVPAQLSGAGATYSSDRFVLLDYTAADGRPAIRAFRVLREKPTDGIVFDYPVAAGTLLQAPMPLPFLPPPVDAVTRRNYNTEPAANSGDLPTNWQASMATGNYSNYASFTYRDRKENYWVMRGVHAGQPALQAGRFQTNSSSWTTSLPAAVAILGQPFTNVFHTSRRTDSLVLALETNSPALPPGLSINGLTLAGTPTTVTSSNLYRFTITDVGDNTSVTNTLVLTVTTNSSVVSQGPLTVQSTNRYAGNTATYVGRPPFLAAPAVTNNCFTMRFYYKTQPGFAWPGIGNAPAEGSIVPYLRPLNDGGSYVGAPGERDTASLDIVYRPYWPGNPPKMAFGETLTEAKNGLPAIRGQTSVQVLYQQSIGQNITNARASVVLHDPTREKTFALSTGGLSRLPDGVHKDSYQGRVYFPKLPPHLAQRFYFDPNRGQLGSLVLRGEFKDEVIGEKYLLLNVLGAQDLETVKSLCPNNDTSNKTKWDTAVAALATAVETFRENPNVPGAYRVETSTSVGVGALAEITDDDMAVDSYALSAAGPGSGYVTVLVGGGEAFTPKGEPVSAYVMRVTGSLYRGSLKVLPSANPLNELVSFQHTADLAGKFSDYEYEWRINPPVDGQPPASDASMSRYQVLTNGVAVPRYTLGGSGIQALVDNWIVLRYRPTNTSHSLYSTVSGTNATKWSEWTEPQLAEGWIKRVLAGINPFNQRVTDLYNNTVNTDANILTSAGKRWEGDIALNLENINNYGLIEIYETVLRRGKALSIEAGINFGPANDALLLAAGYLNDLYMLVGNEALADAANPTIGIGTKDKTYGDIATALFAFKGQMPSLLEEELALLRGRDDVLQPGVTTAPVYNRLFWNYTRGIDAGEVIYALNYNILDQNTDGKADAADAAKLYPQGHGDAYGHYLTAAKGYYALLINTQFDWVPRVEAVTVLGKAVTVDYFDERKFASAGAALARAGRQIFDLTWRKDYVPGRDLGWDRFSTNRVSTRDMVESGTTNKIVRHWGADQWASRAGQGAFLNWVIGNALLPSVDPDPTHEGIQRIDRTTVPELTEIATTAEELQTGMDNAEGRLTPLGLAEGSLAFDINPNIVVGANPQPHFEQIYDRAKRALNNALAAFDDAKEVTRLMRSEQDSLADFRAGVDRQELAYTNALIELYGTPYPDDVGPGKTYQQGFAGPDLLHYMYVQDVALYETNGLWAPNTADTFKIDIQQLPTNWVSSLGVTNADWLVQSSATKYSNGVHYIEYKWGPHGFLSKPANWTGKRQSPGKIQQAISEFIAAHDALYVAIADARSAKEDLDKAKQLFDSQGVSLKIIRGKEGEVISTEKERVGAANLAEINSYNIQMAAGLADDISQAISTAVPDTLIAGLAFGGSLGSAAKGQIYLAGKLAKNILLASDAIQKSVWLNSDTEREKKLLDLENEIKNLGRTEELKQAVADLGASLKKVQEGGFVSINAALRRLDDATRQYDGLIAAGDRIQAERLVVRQRAAAVIQGYRTRDAAFRLFRNEKLERYKALFDLAARYSYLAANAYDYETGLLNTPKGKAFVNRIVNSRALGVVREGEPQFAGSNTGDPGLSSALAEMKADWDVLKGRLGFNNPDAYGTTVSLRTEALRILPGAEGNGTWQDMLQAARKVNILDDADVRRYCLQVDPGNGLPVPGIVLEFSTTIANGYNLFGQPLAAGDSDFSPSRFATKLYGAGVAFIGYRGMSDPAANSGAVSGSGSTSPSDPSQWYLDPKALAATPDIYLIPVGVDSMRSPPLGDASAVRSWTVDDVTIPLPFNIGGTDFSTKQLYQSSESLTEALFSIRKHQSFRPVSTTAAFAGNIYGATGSLQPSQYTNRRLIGRSVWNSKWKLIIPGYELLNNPNEGLDRFIQTVTDVKLHLVTYSYSGN